MHFYELLDYDRNVPMILYTKKQLFEGTHKSIIAEKNMVNIDLLSLH